MTALRLVPAPWQGRDVQASTGGGNPPVAAGGRLPAEGSMPWIRAWHGDGFKRGAQVRVAGRKARVLSAGGGFVNVLIWSTGRRVTVRPSEVTFR